MECADRFRLMEVLKIASQELGWVMQEEVRILKEEPRRSQEFGRLVRDAEEHRQRALREYLEHVNQHGCQRQEGAAARSSGGGSVE